jgi:hypothetical protein
MSLRTQGSYSYTYVRHASYIQVSLPYLVVPGDKIRVVASKSTFVTDNLGNTYQLRDDDDHWYAVASSTGPLTVTATGLGVTEVLAEVNPDED